MYQPIEKMVVDKPIWVLKYDIFFKGKDFCSSDTPGATKFTDCHGWYETEADAIKVRNSLKGHYNIEKVYKRELI